MTAKSPKTVKQAGVSNYDVLRLSHEVMCALARGAGAYPVGEDARDVVRNVRLLISEVDHPTPRQVTPPKQQQQLVKRNDEGADIWTEDDLTSGI